MKIQYIIFSAFFLFSCIKKDQKVSEEFQVIQHLNNNESGAAIDKIDVLLNKDPENSQLLYLKASALSIKAGVDVYKLFPLLKDKIFDVAITQWSDQREFERRLEERRKGGTIEPSTPGEYKPLTNEKIKYEILNLSGYASQDYKRLFVQIKTQSLKSQYHDDVFYVDLVFDFEDEIYLAMTKNPNDWQKTVQDLPLFKEKLIEQIKKMHLEQWEDKVKKISKKKNQERGVQVVWKFVDMIPILKSIPKISQEGVSELQNSQDLLLKIIKLNKTNDTQIISNAKKQLMMISALKIIARIQSAFKLEEIHSPLDILCNVEESSISLALDSMKDGVFLINSIDENDMDPKKNKELREIRTLMNQTYKNFDEEPSYRSEVELSLIKSIEQYKELECMNGNN